MLKRFFIIFLLVFCVGLAAFAGELEEARPLFTRVIGNRSSEITIKINSMKDIPSTSGEDTIKVALELNKKYGPDFMNVQ